MLHLSERPHSRLAGKAASPTVKFTPDLWSGWHMPNLGLFIFTRCIPTHWIFACTGLSAMSNLNIYLRAPLRSWGSFSFSVSPTFLEGVLKRSENISNHFHASWLDFFLPPDPQIISAVSTIVDGFLCYSSIVWRVFLGSCLYQKVPCFIGAPKFLEGLLRTCERCPVKSFTCLIV